jgi:hypothetical protein
VAISIQVVAFVIGFLYNQAEPAVSTGKMMQKGDESC